MSKPKTFRPWNPEQTLLLPPSPVDWLPENHLVFFLLDLAAELDLDARGRIDRKIRSKAGQAIYTLRKTIVEPVSGQIVGGMGLKEWTLVRQQNARDGVVYDCSFPIFNDD